MLLMQQSEEVVPISVELESIKQCQFLEADSSQFTNIVEVLLFIQSFLKSTKQKHTVHIVFKTTDGIWKVSNPIKSKTSVGLVLDEGLVIPYFSIMGLHLEIN